MYPIVSEKDPATRGASACAARAIPPFDIRYSAVLRLAFNLIKLPTSYTELCMIKIDFAG
jgi:hypothetical protein